MKVERHHRHALSRAWFFIKLAEECPKEKREHFEAFMEASIVFARAAIHRLKESFPTDAQWRAWLKSLNDPSIDFFRRERDFILKDAPPKVGQVVKLGPATMAKEFYYFEDPYTPATDTIKKHLQAIEGIVVAIEKSENGT